MNQDQPELTFEESMKQVMKSLPPAIRDYITGEKYTPVAQSLMTKYNLRIDQGGVLEREILLLLMGVENPAEFTQALAEDGQLNKIVIAGIVQDVNDQIFVPLRKEEEKGGVVPEVRPQFKQELAPEVRPSPEFPKVEPQIQKAELQKTVPQPVSNFNLENKIPVPRQVVVAPALKKDWSNLPPAPMKGTLPPKEFLPRASSLGEVVRSVLAVPKPTDTKMLEDHEEAHIEMKKEEMPKPVAPKVEPQIQNAAARPQVAPENLPGVMMEPVTPVAPTVSKPVIPEVQPSPILKVEPQIQIPRPVPVAPVAPVPAPAPITSYPSDPYREPIDEPPGN